MSTSQVNATLETALLPQKVIDAGVRALINEIGYDFNGDVDAAVHDVFLAMLRAAEDMNIRMVTSKSL